MASASIDVSGTPPTGTYTQTSGAPQITATSAGQITVTSSGENTLAFYKAGGQSWNFTGVDITPSGGSVTVASVTSREVVLNDDDEQTGDYTYCLKTDEGNFDPQILNRPT